ncbi:MAG: NTP transferase domain-containing protein [Firmicutes bacterium]|nr:NTP transferase domain-containing protein [Bacillota bacterium]
MAQGIILAAGHSSRAQTNKMLLMYLGKPLLWHALTGLRPFVSHIYVVSGKHHQAISELVHDMADVTVVYNERYEEGMFSSVLAGVSKVEEDFFILPGDCPLVGPETYRKLLRGSKPLRVPVYL